MDPADAAGGKRRTQAWMGPPIQPQAPTRSLRWVPNPAPAPQAAALPAYPQAAASSPSPSPSPSVAAPIGSVRVAGVLVGGRYRLLRSLGQGALTETWEASHVDLERGVAIKFTRQTDPAVVERVVEEARAIAKIRHPHVVEYSDFGRTEQGEPFFVMELLTGQSVEQLLARRRVIPWARAVSIIQQVAEALGAAHQHGIVHRDLRPGNVFLVDVGQGSDFVKVVDFGLARGSVTPSYMSPEQCRGEALDPRSDVYAMGCLLFAMITGEPPFVGDPQRVIARQLEETPKSLRELAPRQFIPDELEAIVARCLAKHPQQRFADTRELAAALAQISPASSMVAPMPDPSASGSRPMGYAGRPPPKSPRELTDSYRPINQTIVDDEPEEPPAAPRASVPAKAGLSVGTIIAASFAGLLAVASMGVGMYWLVNRLIGDEGGADVRGAPEASDRAAVQPTESREAAPAPVPVQPQPTVVVAPVPASEPATAGGAASADDPAVIAPHEEPTKPAKKSPSKASRGRAAEEQAVPESTPPPPAPDPEPEKKKPSVEPDSKAKDKIGHDDLLDPWG